MGIDLHRGIKSARGTLEVHTQDAAGMCSCGATDADSGAIVPLGRILHGLVVIAAAVRNDSIHMVDKRKAPGVLGIDFLQ